MAKSTDGDMAELSPNDWQRIASAVSAAARSIVVGTGNKKTIEDDDSGVQHASGNGHATRSQPDPQVGCSPATPPGVVFSLDAVSSGRPGDGVRL